MFGKYFAQTFTGSMVGKGVIIHAVWGYCIANSDMEGRVEFHPKTLAAIFGDITEEQVRAALDFLCSPDPESRTKTDDGKRLEQTAAYEWCIINHRKFRDTRSQVMRREQNREAKQRQRARDAATPPPAKRKPGRPKRPVYLPAVAKPERDPENPATETVEPHEMRGVTSRKEADDIAGAEGLMDARGRGQWPEDPPVSADSL